MNNGKRTCSLLKSIRCKIAEQNGIEFYTPECTFQGECKGTCPKCEEELRYLVQELEKLRQSGKKVAIAGIAATVIATSAAGCARPSDSFGIDDDVLVGIVAEEPAGTDDEFAHLALDGDMEAPTYEPDSGSTLTGDIVLPPNEEPLTGTAVMPMPKIEKIAQMSEADAVAELVGRSYDFLRREWVSYLLLTDGTEWDAEFFDGAVTVRVRAENGYISEAEVIKEEGEDCDE